jgi:hypothetical protein
VQATHAQAHKARIAEVARRIETTEYPHHPNLSK